MHLPTYAYINTQKKFWKNTQLPARRVGLEIGKGKGLSIFIHVLLHYLHFYLNIYYFGNLFSSGGKAIE